MTYPFRAGAPLDQVVPGSRLFRDWCADALVGLDSAGPGPGATAETQAAVFAANGVVASEPGPNRTASFADIAGDVIVTGQQPGFLGGPLLTLHKVATAIAAARLRSRAGRPTTPVFWCGDDDDDLAEALAPVAWDPASRTLLRADGREALRRSADRADRIGTYPAARWCGGAARWLAATAAHGRSDLAGDLAALWHRALAEDWTWSRLNVAGVKRLFGDSGLVIIRGDDPHLHEAADGIYARILEKTDELAALASARGAEMEARSWHAQISVRSLARPLFQTDGARRRAVTAAASRPRSCDLRPGVMLRSLVQDWLLRPVGVVVGPAEVSYLRQLDPLYSALEMPRCGLVPRLFAWLEPSTLAPGVTAAHDGGATADATAPAAVADEAAEGARIGLELLLSERLGWSSARAAALAAGRARRWRRGVEAMVRHETEQLRRAGVPREPAWVFPDGQRQERKLAVFAAAALWGDDLVKTAIAAAEDHLRQGAQGRWRQYHLEVPEPEGRT